MSLYNTTTIWTGNLTSDVVATIKTFNARYDATLNAWVVPALSIRERSKVYAMFLELAGITVAPFVANTGK